MELQESPYMWKFACSIAPAVSEEERWMRPITWLLVSEDVFRETIVIRGVLAVCM